MNFMKISDLSSSHKHVGFRIMTKTQYILDQFLYVAHKFPNVNFQNCVSSLI